MFKESWPTKSKIKSLRKQGKTAYSSFVFGLTMAIGVVAFLLFSLKALFFALAKYLKLSAANGFTEVSNYKILIETLSESALILSILLLLLAVISILAQTKFLFRFNLVSFNLLNLNPFYNLKKVQVLLPIIKICFFWPVLIILAAIIFTRLLHPFLNLFNLERQAIVLQLIANLEAYLQILIIAFLIAMPISFFLGLFLFYFRNRMSAEELLSEGSEEERNIVRQV